MKIDPRIILVIIFLECLNLKITNAQLSEGPNVGSNVAIDASAGSLDWGSLNLVDIIFADNAYASATAVLLGSATKYAKITGFNFDIPADAAITGIEVAIEKSATGLLANVTDNAIRIVKNGLVTGDNKAKSGGWPASDAVFTYGNSNELWGETWTPSEINATDFGIVISVSLAGSLALTSARIDRVAITVFYNIILPIELVFFKPEISEERVTLLWATASEKDNDYFVVERSRDGLDFESVASVAGAAFSNEIRHYEVDDPSPVDGKSYYRLKQVDFDGSRSFSRIIAVMFSPEKIRFIYPVPNPGERFFVQLQEPFPSRTTITIYDRIGGTRLAKEYPINPDGSVSVELDPKLLPGIYSVSVSHGNSFRLEKFLVK